MNPLLIPIPMEDELVHTPDNHYHEDSTLIAGLAEVMETGGLTSEQASEIVTGTSNQREGGVTR